MIVSALNSNDDWTFGRGRAGYKKNSDEVRQSVSTRLKCFVNDWYLNITDGIDWYALLGQRGTRSQILREVERRVLETAGVRSITTLEIRNLQSRVLTIGLRFTTIYDDTIEESVKVEI
jgi:hypothetical protein